MLLAKAEQKEKLNELSEYVCTVRLQTKLNSFENINKNINKTVDTFVKIFVFSCKKYFFR